jgi:hypothetical protein
MTWKHACLATGFVSGHDFSRAETDKIYDGFSRCKTAGAKAHFLFLGFLRHDWKPCPDTNQERPSGFQTR